MSEARVLVGTVDGLYELGGSASRQALGGHRVTALAAGSRGGWLALVDGDSLWSDGDPWQRVVGLDQWSATCLSAVDGALLAGTRGAHLLRLDPAADTAEPVEGFDRAEGRDSWYTPWGGPPDTRSITGAAGAIYVNVHVGGILRSMDGGRQWQPTIDIHTDVHQVLALSGERVLAAGAVGLAVSDDGGGGWRVDTDGLHATYLRAVAAAGDHVLVSASDGPGGGRSALYRRPLGAGGAGPFERCRQGLPEWFAGNVDTGCLDAGGGMVAAGVPGGSVFVSTDAGRSWETMLTGLPDITCVAVDGGPVDSAPG